MGSEIVGLKRINTQGRWRKTRGRSNAQWWTTKWRNRESLRNKYFFGFFLNEKLLYLRSLPYESALRIAENFAGGKVLAPKNNQKMHFWNFWGADNFPPQIFQIFLGHFHKAILLSTTGPNGEKK